jgi:bifunctional non-homologous end joining protein LigD
VQKHDATRLHYDFRLELDGVLLSWAVTKGPSINPGDKRLAARTEDHPLSYGTFEGTWEPKGDPRAGLKKGHLSFTLHGERLNGGWDLVWMRAGGKRENWLLIKEADKYARVNGSFLDNHSFSVKSGSSMNEIAGQKAPALAKNTKAPSTDGVKRLTHRYPGVQLATLVDKDKNADEVIKETPVKTIATTAGAGSKRSDSPVLNGIAITHPGRVISEAGHISKGELARYYAAAAPFLLPGIKRHPLSLLRCPSGVGNPCFYQRNPGKGLGPDVHPFKFKYKGKTHEYLYIDDEKGLLEVIQMNAIEIHAWGATVDTIGYPDRLIFDLDPAPDVAFEALKLAAQDLRRRLQQKGLESVLKCTGGKGLHITVPLAGKDNWARVKWFAASIAKEMVAAAPEAYVANMSKAKRAGKIFIDYFRNDYAATSIADYAVRASPGTPVALLLEWTELRTLKAASQFTMKSVLRRLKGNKPDALSRQEPQRIPAVFAGSSAT